ncbi:RNA polymerase sigma factor [Pseudonocardia sp. GCM10023141]|uniref:RNA polymerase sigma factor n=1 Tax=Pseudonocardia sp. GCM10023141 TaxID=3252653 RepID=UPI00361D39FF
MNDSRPEGLVTGIVCDPTEQRLRHALINDLDAGFADMMHQYGAVLYSVARGLTVNPADAEDLVAESFLRAYRALAGYGEDRIAALTLRPWLVTILRNIARNAARDASRRPAGPPRHDPTERDLAPGATAPTDPAGQAEQREVQHSLAALLAQLPEVERTAVLLRHALDMPITEIAQILKVKDGTAKSHISRGLQHLRVLVTDTAFVSSTLLLVSDDTARADADHEDIPGGHQVLTVGRRRR